MHIRNSFIYIYIYTTTKTEWNQWPTKSEQTTNGISDSSTHILLFVCCLFFRVWKQLNTKNVTVGHVLVCYLYFIIIFIDAGIIAVVLWWNMLSIALQKSAFIDVTAFIEMFCAFSEFLFTLIISTVRAVKEWIFRIFRIFPWFQQNLGIYNIFLVSN